MTDIEAKARELARKLCLYPWEPLVHVVATALREARNQALDDALAACKFGTSAADCEIAILALKDRHNA